MSSDSKRYALVKWLENSRFDANNEWFGRITSVVHTNIIDFDAEELKTGMEISVFRNGEVWRAQVIIPKTTMNTIDLPPSNHKIRAIVMPIKDATELTNLQDTIQKQQSTFQEANDYDGLLDTNTLIQHLNDQQQQQSQQHNNTNTTKSKQPNTSINNNNNSKEWQFIDNVINDVNALDIFQQSPNNNQSTNNIVNTPPPPPPTTTSTNAITMNGVRLQTPTTTNNNNTATTQLTTTINNRSTPIIHHDSNNNNQQETSAETCEINFETILQMHCELIDQQKDLRKIELETIEQLKLLQRNVSKLNKKFDLFEQNVLKSSESAQSVKSNKSSAHKHIRTTDQFHRRDKHNEIRVNPIVDNSNLMNTITCVSTGINNSSPANNINNPLLSSTSSYMVPTTKQQQQHQQQQQQQQHHQLNEQSSSSNVTSLYAHQKQQQLTTLIVQQPPQSTVPQLTIIQHPPNAVAHLQQTPFHDIEIEPLQVPSNNNNNNGQQDKHNNYSQVALNRFLRESVKKRCGEEFLLNNAISDIPTDVMKEIKKEAFETYLPMNERPMKAWCLAMASLRCYKRDLIKNKNKSKKLLPPNTSTPTTPSQQTSPSINNKK